MHPLITARLAALAHPIGVAVLLIAGGSVASSAFAALHGSGNGILKIARGTVPLAISGPANYGYRLVPIGLPSRFMSALAPFGFAVLLDNIGASILFVTAGLSLTACAAFCVLQAPSPCRLTAPRTPTSSPSSTAQVFVQISAFYWPALLPQMMRHRSLSNREAGWIISSFYAAYMVSVPVLVTLTDRIGAKCVYLFGVSARRSLRSYHCKRCG